ncbi:hypothetical protein [Chitinophaga sp. YIM B06452]|uniref:hypothetical protein n=1 Tax=Chitinophaga sp. YIM B06452 TaxID=3082158 RepID=UPI0031FEC082
MNLKNFTSEVPADRSVSRIERRLVEIGATNISKQCDAGILAAVSFVILQSGTSVAFRLPARVEAVKAPTATNLNTRGRTKKLRYKRLEIKEMSVKLSFYPNL